MPVANSLTRGVRKGLSTVRRTLDTEVPLRPRAAGATGVEWTRWIPFAFMHLACLLVLWVGFSWTALTVAVVGYVVRMFAITGFYHRYFSHRTFRTSRAFQFIMGFAGCCAVQRGPLWWAAHHRHHHKHSDTELDLHSPRMRGFLWSHMGWFTARENYPTRMKLVPDLAKFPELMFINRYDILPPVVFGIFLYGLGTLLQFLSPGLETSGSQILVWGLFVSTVVLYHGTYTINSLAHQIGRRRFKTSDDSRNSFFLAMITLGEGWHNNHHHYPASVRQGFYWWELDLTYYGLRLLSWMGLIWDLHPVPQRVLDRGRRQKP